MGWKQAIIYFRAGPLESREGFIIGSGKVEQRQAGEELRTSDVKLRLPQAHGREAAAATTGSSVTWQGGRWGDKDET